MGTAAALTAAWHIGPAGSWLPGVRRLLLPALDGRGDPGHVALTFDDGPDPVSTPRFLDALDRLGVRATFFVTGRALLQAPGTGRELVARGHEAAVHGWGHERPWLPRPVRDIEGVARTVGLVTETTGAAPHWYRPPYGILTGGRLLAARRAGLRTVLWSAWGRDWDAWADPASVLATLRPGLRGGATILLHDSDRTSAPGSWRNALGALPELVAWCRDRGLTVGPLGAHGLTG